MDLAKLDSEPRFLIACPEQGVFNSNFTQDEALAWLGREFEYWEFFRGVTTVNDPMLGAARVNLSILYQQRIVKIREDVRAFKSDSLAAFTQLGASFQAVIAQGRVGGAIMKLAEEDINQGVYLACSMSSAIVTLDHPNLELSFRRNRALLITSPAFLESTGLLSAQTRDEASRALIEAVETRSAEMKELQERLEQENAELHERQRTFEKDTEERLTSLHDLYHKKMQTEAAAVYWETKASSTAKAAGWALFAFVVLLALPFLYTIFNFGIIEQFLLRLTAASADKFSLTPLVAISVPVLGYAWLLRHVSRIFIQSRALADDASYRRTMTMTYLGLSKDPTSGITHTERAIILNALFRPAPPNTSDDGPPSGLLDLIKAKP